MSVIANVNCLKYILLCIPCNNAIIILVDFTDEKVETSEV